MVDVKHIAELVNIARIVYIEEILDPYQYYTYNRKVKAPVRLINEAVALRIIEDMITVYEEEAGVYVCIKQMPFEGDLAVVSLDFQHCRP